ncbi:hypothetical protein GGR50DRAFT_677929 [Xylaria sp. CBS 124048]|nr:hypothetical protein GGR50DRAFT_677929 [Xylaria sp. CBS 124048]
MVSIPRYIDNLVKSLINIKREAFQQNSFPGGILLIYTYYCRELAFFLYIFFNLPTSGVSYYVLLSTSVLHGLLIYELIFF